MKKTYSLLLLSIVLNINAQNTFPPGDVEINNANLTIETASWRPSLLTLKDTHYNPNEVYNFQIESDGLKIKQDGNVNYQFKSGGNFIVNNGNVMLGQGNPLFKLHIKDPAAGAALALERGGKLWRFDITNNADKLFIGHTDNANMLTIHKNGNVGIGVNNPKSPFVIGYNNGVNQLALQRSDGKETFLMHINSNNQITFKNKTGSGDYDFQTNIAGQNMASALFIEGTNGNIGIGTTAPDTKLAVNGVIHSKEVKVDLVGWPDYVFKNNYQLPTLKEVENHINEKGHLKDIPSEKEVEENGVNLGEMNAKLLQKIEELTLYTIQQEGKINKLEKENIQLKSLSYRLTKIEKLLKTKK